MGEMNLRELEGQGCPCLLGQEGLREGGLVLGAARGQVRPALGKGEL